MTPCPNYSNTLFKTEVAASQDRAKMPRRRRKTAKSRKAAAQKELRDASVAAPPSTEEYPALPTTATQSRFWRLRERIKETREKIATLEEKLSSFGSYRPSLAHAASASTRSMRRGVRCWRPTSGRRSGFLGIFLMRFRRRLPAVVKS